MTLFERLRRWWSGDSGAQVLHEAPAKKQKANTVKKIKRVGLADTQGSRDELTGPSFDLQEIQSAYHTDSYIRQAVDKYIELMFKSGWSINGSNQSAVDYIKTRFAYMELLTGQPTNALFVEMGEDLVKYSNVFILKSRGDTPNIKATGVSGSKPINGYFLVSPITMQIARDINGTVLKYQQEIQGEDPIEFKPEDVIHMYYKRERGAAFGTPFLISCLDDVKILRHLEENTVRMVHKNIWPLYVYTVGLAEPGYESTDTEIEEVRDELESMPIEGGLILPERHKMSVIGSDGEALSVADYLQYFEQRVFTGLGVSAAIMGRSESTSRSSAEVMSSEMHDRVKAYQRSMELFINTHIIQELLLEGGFDPIKNPKDIVEFRFAEIDLASKIAIENQAIQKFIANTISHDEFRQEVGMEPETDYSKYFANLFGSVDEGVANAVQNKAQPANQQGKRNAPKV